MEICIDNIASCKKTRDYKPLRAMSDCPRVPIRGADLQAVSPLGRLALEGLNSQTQALENIYSSMLIQLDELYAEARVEESDLKALQLEIDQLFAAM